MPKRQQPNGTPGKKPPAHLLRVGVAPHIRLRAHNPVVKAAAQLVMQDARNDQLFRPVRF